MAQWERTRTPLVSREDRMRALLDALPVADVPTPGVKRPLLDPVGNPLLDPLGQQLLEP